MECSICGDFKEDSYVLEEPEYGESHFFCSLNCLDGWVKKEQEKERRSGW